MQSRPSYRLLRTCAATAGVLVLATSGAAAAAQPAPSLDWEFVESPVTAGIRGLDVVSSNVVWAASDGADVIRTTDGGASWDDVAPPDSEGLFFRDVEAFDADHAVVLAIGSGDASRVFVTADGGATWEETFRNPEPAGFLNCMSFWNDDHGVLTGDPVDGRYRVLTTSDGGRTWSWVPDAGMPPALPDEYQFSASGTCVETAGGTAAWFGGGGSDARVFHTHDRGRTWSVTDPGMRSAEAGGVISLAFRTPRHGIAIGGDYLAPEDNEDYFATTRDGGHTWQLVDEADAPDGYRQGSAWLRASPHTVVAVGATGSDVSTDGGLTWTEFSGEPLNAVECGEDGACWASGSRGTLARLIRK